MRKEELLKEMIRKRKDILTKISKGQNPIIEEQLHSHEERVHRALGYLEELEEVSSVIDSGVNVVFLRQNIFERTMTKSDYAEIVYEGDYVKISIVANYPDRQFWIIHLAPLAVV